MHKLEPHRAEFELTHLYLKNWILWNCLIFLICEMRSSLPFTQDCCEESVKQAAQAVPDQCVGSVNNSIITRADAILLEHNGSQGLQSTFQIQISVLSNYPIPAFDHSLFTCPISSSRPEPIFLHTFLFLLVINLERVKTRERINQSYISKHIFKGKMSLSDHILFLFLLYLVKSGVNLKYSLYNTFRKNIKT